MGTKTVLKINLLYESSSHPSVSMCPDLLIHLFLIKLLFLSPVLGLSFAFTLLN